jgi:proline iminopeptidase
MDEVLADDGCRLWARRDDPGVTGDAMVMCHGGPGLWDMFGDLSGALAATTGTVRWDQRGCGRSEHRGPYTVERSLADLDTVRRQLGGDRPALLGHSWGATLALLYALAHPDRVRCLIYVCGVGIDTDQPWLPAYRRNLRDRLGSRYPRWERLRERKRTEAEDRELMTLRWGADFPDPRTSAAHVAAITDPWFGVNQEAGTALLADTVTHARDVADRCERLDLPVLIVQGAGDLRPASVVDSLHRALPRVERIMVDGGHMPWIDDPAGFAGTVSEFLDRSR